MTIEKTRLSEEQLISIYNYYGIWLQNNPSTKECAKNDNKNHKEWLQYLQNNATKTYKEWLDENKSNEFWVKENPPKQYEEWLLENSQTSYEAALKINFPKERYYKQLQENNTQAKYDENSYQQFIKFIHESFLKEKYINWKDETLKKEYENSYKDNFENFKKWLQWLEKNSKENYETWLKEKNDGDYTTSNHDEKWCQLWQEKFEKGYEKWLQDKYNKWLESNYKKCLLKNSKKNYEEWLKENPQTTYEIWRKGNPIKTYEEWMKDFPQISYSNWFKVNFNKENYKKRVENNKELRNYDGLLTEKHNPIDLTSENIDLSMLDKNTKKASTYEAWYLENFNKFSNKLAYEGMLEANYHNWLLQENNIKQSKENYIKWLQGNYKKWQQEKSNQSYEEWLNEQLSENYQNWQQEKSNQSYEEWLNKQLSENYKNWLKLHSVAYKKGTEDDTFEEAVLLEFEASYTHIQNNVITFESLDKTTEKYKKDIKYIKEQFKANSFTTEENKKLDICLSLIEYHVNQCQKDCKEQIVYNQIKIKKILQKHAERQQKILKNEIEEMNKNEKTISYKLNYGSKNDENKNKKIVSKKSFTLFEMLNNTKQLKESLQTPLIRNQFINQCKNLPKIKSSQDKALFKIFSNKTCNNGNAWKQVFETTSKQLQHYRNTWSISSDRETLVKNLIEKLEQINRNQQMKDESGQLNEFLYYLNQVSCLIVKKDFEVDEKQGLLSGLFFSHRNQNGSRLQKIIQNLTSLTISFGATANESNSKYVYLKNIFDAVKDRARLAGITDFCIDNEILFLSTKNGDLIEQNNSIIKLKEKLLNYYDNLKPKSHKQVSFKNLLKDCIEQLDLAEADNHILQYKK
jgi:hypothetical protein